MRFSFRKKDDAPRWVDLPDFHWVPESPLYAEPAPGSVSGWKDADWNEPRAAVPLPAQPSPPRPARLIRQAASAPPLFLPRLVIGLAQTVALYLLWQARAAGFWPASDPALFSACWLGGLVAPLLLLEGLGAIEPRRLLLWSGAIGFGLATLGLFLPAMSHPVPLLAAVLVAIVLAQGWFRAALHAGAPLPARADLGKFTWTVVARLSACALIWGMLALPALGWPRWDQPVPLTPLLGPVAAVLFAATTPSRRILSRGLRVCFWLGLPLLLLGALPLAGVYLLRWLFLQGY